MPDSNVFFDLSRHEIGFQPIDGFKRTLNPDFTKRYVDVEDFTGTFGRITKVLDVPDNPYREAGAMVGDVVVAINGVKYGEQPHNFSATVVRSKKHRLDILRNGKAMKLTLRYHELGE